MVEIKNRDVASLFEQVADMLAIRGDSFHRINAYRRAAESIRSLSRALHDIHAEGSLTEIPGIGKTLAEKIVEVLTTGELVFYHKLAEDVPPSLLVLLQVEGLGPKKIKLIYETLGITSLDALATAAREGQLQRLPRMGVRSEQKILANIKALQERGDARTPLGQAWPIAQAILDTLAAVPGVSRTAVAGSLRRMKETVGDIDLLVAAEDPAPVMAAFRTLPEVESVVASGVTKTRVVLRQGIGVDLRVLPAERWGTLLSYFTGSQAHNIRLRELALQKGLHLNEHAFTPADGGAEILCATEEMVYETLGLPYIAPQLREDFREIEAAHVGRLPTLVGTADMLGDLHMHTTWSDGKATILEMAQAAQARGHQYIAITDHSVGLPIANGLSVERLRQQAEAVRLANAEMGEGFRILHGTEMEIRADGTLDFPDDVLAELDFVIASLHVSLKQPRAQITERLLGAIDNPHVDMIAHPTGRLLGRRDGADLDMDAIFMAAARTQTILEVNANPRRLDLRDRHVRRALQIGVKIAINTDAHRIEQLDLLHYGVATAQRGWAQPRNVVNTWPIESLLAWLARE